jgi:hypothetical protein
VCLGEVGAVAAREVSRFARNSREWQHLVEVCRVVDTLLIDQETIYAPRHGNDRLLLGLKGSLNEYELDLLRQRSVEARREKARRGELIVAAPVGFVKTEDQRLECRSRPEREPVSRRECAGSVVARWGAGCNAAGPAWCGDERGDGQPGGIEVSGLAEIQGGVVKGQAAGGGPEVQRIAVGAAGEAAVELPA